MKCIGDAIRLTLTTGVKHLPEGVRTKRLLRPNGSREKVSAHKWIESGLHAAMKVYRDDLPLDCHLAKKCMALVNMKHVIKFDKPTKQHIEKFNMSVESKTFIKWSDIGLPNPIISGHGRKVIFEQTKIQPKFPSVYSYRATDKKQPIYDNGRLSTRPSFDPESRDVTPLFTWYVSSDANTRMILKESFKTILHYKCNRDKDYLTRALSNSLKMRGFSVRSDTLSIRGKISHIMESGGKDRAICQPFLVYQALFEPLKEILHAMSRADKFVYTDNQELGMETAMSLLKEGKTLYCYDASSFTDSFPLDYQLSVLEKYGLNDWSTLLKSFMQGTFYDPEQNRTIKYQQGQPMGLGPSFHLATLSHSDMIYSLYKDIYPHTWKKHLRENPYGVVGDDVFISDELVARTYKILMGYWGVKINDSKSLISNRYGEFCGAIFSKDSFVPPFKPKRFKWQHDQLASAVRYYGPTYLEFLRKDSKDLAIFTSRLITEGGYKRVVDTINLLNIIKKDVIDFISDTDNLACYPTLPHYEFLQRLTRGAVNLNHERGYHVNRFKLGGTEIFHNGGQELRHPKPRNQFESHLFKVLKRNDLYSILDDIEALIILEKEIKTDVDVQTFQEMLIEVWNSWKTTQQDLSEHVPQVQSDPSVKKKTDVEPLFVSLLERIEQQSDKVATTISELHQVPALGRRPNQPSHSLSVKPKRKLPKPDDQDFGPQ
mgnify:CR=1 FL=1